MIKPSYPLSIILLAAVFIGCEVGGGSDPVYEISGIVTDDAGDGFSGVEVRLYETASISAALNQYKLVYPTCGAPLSQAWMFDHRLHNAVSSTLSGDDGSFILHEAPAGEYMLTLIHQDCGFKYSGPVGVNNGNLDAGSLQFKEAVHPGAYISQHTIWEGGKCYIIDDQLTVNLGANLTIQPGATIIFGGTNSKITINGTFVAAGNSTQWIRFTSDEINPGESDWDKLYFKNIMDSVSQLKYCLIDYANNAVAANSKKIIVANTVISDAYLGMSICTSIKSEIEDCYILNSRTGIKSLSILQIDQCVFSGCSTAVSVSESQVFLYDNIITDCDTAIVEEFSPGLTIRYNLLKDNKVGIRCKAGSIENMFFEYNDFEDNYNRALWCYFSAYPKIHYNNFSGSQYYIYTQGQQQGTEYKQSDDIEAQNNYWDSTNREYIAGKIRDGDTPGIESWLGLVLFEPYAYSEYTNTGPR